MARASEPTSPPPATGSEDGDERVAGGRAQALRRESEAVAGKIDDAYGKLAAKLRAKADKASAAMETRKDGTKRALLLRRFELYADAAHELEMLAAQPRGSADVNGD